MTEPDILFVDTSALYQVPDYTSAAVLADPRTGVGDPVPLAQRLRNAYPGKPTGPNTVITVPGGGTKLTIPDDANSVLLQVQTAPIRYTTDNSIPSNLNGQRADPGTLLLLTGRDTMQAFTMAAESVTTANVVPVFHT